MIRVVHPEPESLGLIDPAVGSVRLGDLFDIDEGVIVRWDAESIMLMPHGGIAICTALSHALENLGVPHIEQDSPCEVYPEAKTEIEAYMLCELARSMSPLAVDLLLDQPRRWHGVGIDTITTAEQFENVANASLLRRLIEPPIVAAVGRANVGKSTLINTLAGEHVAIVADTAGTTRDHVGVLVDLGGLVVRWIDTPGVDERIADGDEIEIASRVVSQADLIVHCIDTDDESGLLDARLESVIEPGTLRVRVGTRSDLGTHSCDIDVAVSIGAEGGMSQIERLVNQIRTSLVSESVLDDPRPWRFWDAMGCRSIRGTSNS
jgi:small GTP-binding protein